MDRHRWFSAFALLRGCQNSSEPRVYVDAHLRSDLGLQIGDEVELQIKPVRLFGECRWGWYATDPAYRVAAKLGVLSVALGGIGLTLGLIALFTYIAGKQP